MLPFRWPLALEVQRLSGPGCSRAPRVQCSVWLEEPRWSGCSIMGTVLLLIVPRALEAGLCRRRVLGQ